MKKGFLLILCSICLLISGCSNSNNAEGEVTSKNAQRATEVITDFFFSGDKFSFTANITTIDFFSYESRDINNPYRTEFAELQVYKVAAYQNGSIFKLVIPHVYNSQEYLYDERVNIYFYATADKIYRIWSYVYQDEQLIEFYDDDVLLNLLDTEEKIINNGYLIFQLESSEDKLKENDIGFHTIIEIRDNEIKSRAWTTKHNGDTDFYEVFVWDLNDGLIEYKSGFGAEADLLEIKNIVKTK